MSNNLIRPIAYLPLGKPGCGKGTFTETLSQLRSEKIFKSDTGQLIRNTFNNAPGAVVFNQYHRDLFKHINDSGKLQTSATATLHWCQHLRAHYSGEEILIIDGSPRRKFELFQIYEDLQESYNADVRFIHINVTNEVAIKHMQIRHLTNPRPETSSIKTIRLRLQEFDEKVYPTLQIIKSMPGVNFKEITNNGTLEEFQSQLQELFKV